MLLTIAALGRLPAGPEATLIADYQKRLQAAPASIGPLTLIDHDIKKKLVGAARQKAEGDWLLGAAPKGATLIALDERGKALSSRKFSSLLAGLRDEGVRDVAFLIGGADGHLPEIRQQAHHTLSLGALTLPHMLARVVLAEQLWRAAAIASGHPYHRD